MIDSKNLNKWLIIAVLILGGAFILQTYRTRVKSQEIALYEHNIAVAKDSMNVLSLKNGQLLAERQTYILSEKEMTAMLELSKQESEDLRKKLGSALSQISKLESEISTDTITVPGENIYITPDSALTTFDYKDDWLEFGGQVDWKPDRSSVTIYNIHMSLPLTVGMTEDKKFFATTPNPYVQFTNITSTVNVNNIKKKSYWSFGLNLGPGVYYDFFDKNVSAGIGVQIGINYNF